MRRRAAGLMLAVAVTASLVAANCGNGAAAVDAPSGTATGTEPAIETGIASTTTSLLEPPEFPTLSPAPTPAEALAFAERGVATNTNHRDGGLGSICWSFREVTRNLSGLVLAEIQGADLVAARAVLSDALDTATLELATVDAGTPPRGFAHALGETFRVARERLGGPGNMTFDELASPGGSLALQEVPGFDDFVATGESWPACTML